MVNERVNKRLRVNEELNMEQVGGMLGGELNMGQVEVCWEVS